MKNRILLKTVSLTAAALSCTGWLGTGIMPAAAAEAEVTAPASYSEPEQFIVKDEGDAVLNTQSAADIGSDDPEAPESAQEIVDLAEDPDITELCDAEELPKGIYAGPDGFYEFSYDEYQEDAISLFRYEDGDTDGYEAYTFENGKLKIGWRDETAKIGTVKQINEDTYLVIFDDETLTLRYKDTTKLPFDFCTLHQIENRLRTLFASDMPEIEITDITTQVDQDGVAHFVIYGSEDGEPTTISGTVDLLTGDAFSPQLGIISMYPIRFSDIPEGVWKVYGFDLLNLIEYEKDCNSIEFWDIDHDGWWYDYYDLNSTVNIRAQADDAEHYFDWADDDTRITDHDVVGYYYSILNDHQVVLTLTRNESYVLYMEYTGAADFDVLNYFNNAELAEMALAYYGDNQLTADDVDFVVTETGTVQITLGDGLESYDVDVMTGIGTDSKGNAVDLTASLPAMKDPFGKGVWYSDSDFFLFDGNGGCSRQNIFNGTEADFTYEMKSDGMEMVMEDGTVMRAALFPQEDGTVKLNMTGDRTVTLSLCADADPDTFTFIPAENLMNMAMLHSPLDVTSTTYDVNADGTVKIVLLDETGKEIGSYTVDPMTGCGVDENGTTQDLSIPYEPALPEGAYTREELEKMALCDYEARIGEKPAEASAFVRKDGTVLISLTDENGELIDCYTVDPVTGQGTDRNDEAIDLPQTGNNVPAAAATASGAALLLLAGAVMILRSGVLRRKQDAENAI